MPNPANQAIFLSDAREDLDAGRRGEAASGFRGREIHRGAAV